MLEAAIIGIGQTAIDEHWQRSIRDLAGEAIFAALQDADRKTADGIFVGNMLSGLIDQQNNLGVSRRKSDLFAYRVFAGTYQFFENPFDHR